MTLPFALPDWLPGWVPIVVLIPLLLYALAFLFMPFSVIGVKGRLDAIETRLDEIQGEIRSLALRLPEPMRHAPVYDDGPSYAYAAPREAPRQYAAEVPRAYAPEAPPASARPPIPPASYPPELDTAEERRWRTAARGREPERPSTREEPRFDRR